MSDDSGRHGRCTAHLLRLLDGPYRHVWLRAVSRERVGRINYSAVAKVLARAAEVDRPHGVHHRELRDRVRRALYDGRISSETLDLFIRAFGIRRADADQLWTLLLTTNGSGTAALDPRAAGSPAIPEQGRGLQRSDEEIARERRRELADWLKAGGLPDLTGSAGGEG